MSTGWDDLERELDAWQAAGRAATLWWRDDDGRAATPALDSLLAMARGSGTPLALAVIPAGAGASLAERLAGEPLVAIVQHGFDHADHARPGDKKIELAPHRPLDGMRGALADGRERLQALFGGRALAVLVPPWNRVADAVVDALPAIGFTGLSAFGPRAKAIAAPGVRAANAHVDIIDWRGGRGFVGESDALAQAVRHLRARRTGQADGDEPTGLMTHHLDHDAECWDFIEAFVARTSAHAAARWLSAEAIFD
ncbi:MAG: polysaccharide deacetylase family protein [Rhodospirillales bacterium]|jgi:peptidoglycan/xylan/chitin deacetylase (PgdA/CDA1 family)|nr:polysaccharide deacetylase family protein [Rhodospirillales bacterium]MDP6774276.1 polysaccharide deacetylase family protein [Rhodospirillales bacterium]